ncbi:response regulator transcription factor [Geoalkalibacter halelectricus]|uniref:Response regulator transcription factor n=1 Tax=Geoalkalibacter halelectricus TaxID=2847045 RepID=A0ABY5ZMN1_9BACT|nr:response regulator transcription factor [Geoalkalibacter halelectricus]MDO3378352.1 response regulator transcription factor [Geoalkalibacter halelectricus]UWZ80328.1 response regulator transcription factor [Geoalkalibacter halelectricus]
MIRVLIADDHAIMREGLRLLLETQSDLKVVGEAGDGVEALELGRRLKPDIALLDVAMPRMNGIDTTRLLREASPETRVVILSMFEKELYAHQALSAGAYGYVLKAGKSEDLLTAIRTAAGGNYYLCRRIQAAVIETYLAHERPTAPTSEYDELSEREKEVFGLLVQGNSTAQISKILCISSKTVEKHRTAISRKLGLNSAIEMVKFAIRIGVVDPESWKI